MKRSIDWLGIMVRFVCGALLGALFGLGAMATDMTRGQLLWCVGAGAIVGGILSAALGDEFWKNLWWWW